MDDFDDFDFTEGLDFDSLDIGDGADVYADDSGEEGEGNSADALKAQLDRVYAEEASLAEQINRQLNESSSRWSGQPLGNHSAASGDEERLGDFASLQAELDQLKGFGKLMGEITDFGGAKALEDDLAQAAEESFNMSARVGEDSTTNSARIFNQGRIPKEDVPAPAPAPASASSDRVVRVKPY